MNPPEQFKSILLNKETGVGYELPDRRDNYLPHQRRYI